MFGLQEVYISVVSKADSPDNKCVDLAHVVSFCPSQTIPFQLLPVLSGKFCAKPAELSTRRSNAVSTEKDRAPKDDFAERSNT
jgi:hypothetical protein